ncbi:MAG: DUF4124 domain-containing protein [Burkholderiales bacterium]
MTRTIAATLALAWAIAPLPAHADIYTWVDRNGEVHVSNLAPPDDVKVTRVERTAPKDAAREAAQREAARQAEVRALNERVNELKAEVDRTRREAIPPQDAAPPMAYLPAPAYPPIVVNVVSANTQNASPSGACDAWSGDCGVSMWPGYYGGYTGFAPVYVAPVRGHKGHRRAGPVPPPGGGALIPPLIPMPARGAPARLG